MKNFLPTAAALSLLILLGACSSPAPRIEREAAPAPAPKAHKPGMKPNPLARRGGGFYKDDGMPEEVPDNLDEIPDAEPRNEALHRFANRPYVVLGKEYVPYTSLQPYKVRGIASWYGKKFHGQKTSIGEPYDMFAMTAAHPTLAIPSYARVTNVQSGKSVIVRITDRGPFHADRVIDLSFTAAYKLGYLNSGSTPVEVEAIVPEPGALYALAPARELAREVAALRKEAAAEKESLKDPIAVLAGPAREETGAGSSGVFLQLGAFSSPDNAESLKARLGRELDWLAEGLQVHSRGGLHRLHLGPYKDRQEADKVAERIRLVLGFKPTFIVR